MDRVNKTFCGSEPSWANACVGNNGNPGYKEYSKGFSRAARVLIDKVLEEDSIDFHIDDFIYPICFNMRHSVELRLKHSIQMLEQLAKYKGCSSKFDLSGSHDIKNIWCHFKRKSEVFDSRYSEINNRIEPLILDVADIDPTGQTFRYPRDNKNIKHLTETSLINFFNLKSSFSTLEKNLDLVIELNEFLISEYSLGSFTNALSRAQIFEVAKRLPNREKWREPNFKNIKDSIKKDYSLSGKEFEKAVNIISNNYEMAPVINVNLDLLGLDIAQVDEFARIWFNHHEKSITRGSNKVSSDAFMDDIYHTIQRSHESWCNAKGTLTPEVLAGLISLFYFSYDLDFSELYVCRYNDELEICKANFSDENNVKVIFLDLVKKTNALENIVASLFFLGFHDDANAIINTYGFLNASPLVAKAQSRDLFEKNGLFGY
ncbi:hypothetical protein O1B10_001518 [Vibrio cholerae]|nr:hypothetical protein [Vibrio cholerae]EKF9996881.1 hypothetical protein [Vibrio cholerae]EKG0024165.1 hypothetical protein [Vibrio cholerae]